MRISKSQAGFSLLELFVSISLLIVFAGIAAPALSEYNSQFQLQSTTDRIRTEIGRSRMQAMAQNRFIRMRFDDYGNLVREESPDGMTYNVIGSPIGLPTGIVANFSNVSSLVFDSAGVATTTSTITVERAGTTHTLYTNILGRVTSS